MSLFDRLVEEAVQGQGDLVLLRPVVEKELLHHDILREMSEAGLLAKLTFMGGTCLRACYGSNRLSEDLDFTGGADFTASQLQCLSYTLEEKLQTKYGLAVTVTEPTKEERNVATWKVRLISRPAQKHLPAQRINIDICAVPSYDVKPMMLRNLYGVDMGTSGLIVNVESREEILADKIVAFALRPNRLKNRDLWDIGWLRQQGVELQETLLIHKIADHGQSVDSFLQTLNERRVSLENDSSLYESFQYEMTRFLPRQIMQQTVSKPEFWAYLTGEITDACHQATGFLDATRGRLPFCM